MTHSRLKIAFIIIGMLFYSTNSFADVNLLRSQSLSELSGKEGVMLTVSYTPGESSPIHRHNAHTFRRIANHAGRGRRCSYFKTRGYFLRIAERHSQNLKKR